MFIVFVLCISSGGVILRSVSVLYYLTLEKAESLLRGRWLAFNIYRVVSSSRLAWRLAFRLVAASRCASRLLRLVVRPALCLVLPSRFMSVAFRRECLVLLRFAHRVSHRGRFSSRSFRLVSRLAPRLVSHFVPSCRVAFVAGGGSVWGVSAVMVFSCRHMVLGRGACLPVFLIVSAGGVRARWMRRAVLFSSFLPVFEVSLPSSWRMTSIW